MKIKWHECVGWIQQPSLIFQTKHGLMYLYPIKTQFQHPKIHVESTYFASRQLKLIILLIYIEIITIKKLTIFGNYLVAD